MSDLLAGFETQTKVRSNRLFYGDNLTIMQRMPSACVDLIYLDPPFNSQRSYNLIYRQLTGHPVPEQVEAFCDAWELDAEKEEMARKMPLVLREYDADEGLVQFWRAWIDALRHTQPRLLAYLVYMTYRLYEMRRLLKPTGSIWLHCDPNASHYIKVIMDGVFNHVNFRNEVIWQRNTGKSLMSRRLPGSHDVLLAYQRGDSARWNAEAMFTAYDLKDLPEKTAQKYGQRDPDGRLYQLDNLVNPNPDRPNLTYEFLGVTRVWRWTKERMQEAYEQGLVVQPRPGAVPRLKRYLDEQRGRPFGDVWTDIPPLNSQADERLGYPTQKPVKLLDRIVRLCSSEGQVVFDPFCGCGTTIYAAHLNKRKWIGCDIAIWSVKIVRDVLLKRYGLEEGRHYHVTGVPKSAEAAQELFEESPAQFQNWAVEFAGGFKSNKLSGDQGVDGRLWFETKEGLRGMVISVKGGAVTPAHVRELRGTLERERDTELAGFISLREPTKGMREEAAAAGRYEYQGRPYDRIQLRTVADLFAGRGFDTPSRVEVMDWQRQAVLPL
jgi:DNA modification methylase